MDKPKVLGEITKIDYYLYQASEEVKKENMNSDIIKSALIRIQKSFYTVLMEVITDNSLSNEVLFTLQDLQTRLSYVVSEIKE